MDPKLKLVIGCIGILILLVLLTPLTDSSPDGLESTAEEYNAPEGRNFDLGFFTDYGSEGSILHTILGNDSLAVIISGLIGVIIIISIFLTPVLFIYYRRTENTS